MTLVPEPTSGAGGELVLAAGSKEEFGALLRQIAQRSGRTAAQIIAFSGLNKSTVYNYLDEDYRGFARLDIAVRFCQACRLDDAQVAQVEAIWHRLNGTRLVVESPEMVVEAELVDREAVGTGAPAEPMAGPMAETIAKQAMVGANNVVIGGNVRGGVTVNIHQPATTGPTPARAAAGFIVNLAVSAALVAWTIFTVFMALDDPYTFSLETGLILAIAEFILLFCLLIGQVIGARVRNRGPESDITAWRQSLLVRSGPVRPMYERTIWERALSWPSAITAVAALACGAAIGAHVRVRDVAIAARRFTWHSDSGMTAPLLSGLLVGFAVLVLVRVWMNTIDRLAVAFLLDHFPLLAAAAVVCGVVASISAAVQFQFPVGCALVTGVLVTGAVFHLCVSFVDRVVLVPALVARHSGGEEIVNKYAAWLTYAEQRAANSKALEPKSNVDPVAGNRIAVIGARGSRRRVSDNELHQVQTLNELGALLQQEMAYTGLSYRNLEISAPGSLDLNLSRSMIAEMCRGRGLTEKRLRLVLIACGGLDTDMETWTRTLQRVNGDVGPTPQPQTGIRAWWRSRRER
ncbi:helix-turn-helix domain-containing protein [Nocardia asiatica]|uniref:helix-turn-helix domain-containing protein n=1 Tax=Nocardia asiatica TaxID=209252 RepID=UPI003EE3AF6F